MQRKLDTHHIVEKEVVLNYIPNYYDDYRSHLLRMHALAAGLI